MSQSHNTARLLGATLLAYTGACGPVVGIGGEVSEGSTDTAGSSADDRGEWPSDGVSSSAGASSTDSDIPTAGDLDTSGHDSTDESETSSGTTPTGTTEVASTGDTSSTGEPVAADPVAHYQVTIVNTWSEKTHPGALPAFAHFSWLGGATHDSRVTLWDEGALASPGMVQMAEIGNTDILSTEVAVLIDAGHADAALQWQQWFCPPGTDVAVCGDDTVTFDVSLAFPRVTLVSMLGPSPDLFVGVSSLALLVDDAWVDEIVVDLVPYDGGTRSDVDFTMNGALEEPPRVITPITSLDEHMIGPASLGTMTLVRVGFDPP